MHRCVLWFEAAGGEDNDPVPVIVKGLVTVEVEQGFREEAMVEGVVFLKLDFAKEDNFGCGIFGRQENAINAKGGFFDLNGLETVAA
jgi:hypothetical protein